MLIRKFVFAIAFGPATFVALFAGRIRADGLQKLSCRFFPAQVGACRRVNRRIFGSWSVVLEPTANDAFAKYLECQGIFHISLKEFCWNNTKLCGGNKQWESITHDFQKTCRKELPGRTAAGRPSNGRSSLLPFTQPYHNHCGRGGVNIDNFFSKA